MLDTSLECGPTPNCARKHIGFGCSGAWGYEWFSKKKAIEIIHTAIDSGVIYFDTGNFYCNGNAEKRLGIALTSYGIESVKKPLKVSSKVGTRRMANGALVKDFSRESILGDIDTSLKRLKLGSLDALYLHGPNEEQLLQALPILLDLKRERLIANIGVCANGTVAGLAADQEDVDVIMTSVNIFESAHIPALNVARRSGKKTVAIASMAQGLYKRGMFLPKSLPDIWYLIRALVKNRPQLRNAQKARWLHDMPGWSPYEVALAYVLSLESVDVVMTTTTNMEHLQNNVNTAKRELPEEMLSLFATMHEKANTLC